jgi:serine/threonine protein kinase
MGASYSSSDSLSAMTNIPHLPLGHVLLSNHDLFRRMGLRLPLDQLLGRGNFGAAYQVPAAGGSVLKLTRDPSEVQAAWLLRGRNSKRIVYVHDVWAIEGTITDGLQGWYVVHRGYLSPLSKKDTVLIEAIFQRFGDVDLELAIPRNGKQYGMLNRWRNHLRDELSSGDIVTDDEGMATTNFASGQMLKRALILLLQIGEAVNEMHKAGIDWEDIHPDNMMRNAQGRLVIADFGFGIMHEDFNERIPYLTAETARAHVSQQGHEAR